MSTRTAPMKTENPLETRWSLLGRLKDWGDKQSWQEFFDTYWGLIYSVAVKAGLTDSEAKDAAQETLLTVARNIADLKRDPSRGTFKSWLLHTTRWKITDQFRKRGPPRTSECLRYDPNQADTATGPPSGEPSRFDLDAAWDHEWEAHLLAVALERVKQKAAPLEIQIFDLCVLRHVGVKEVAQRLKLKLWKVYFAQRKVTGLLQRELRRVERAGL